MKRTKTHQRPPSPTPANIAVCPRCEKPIDSPRHVCAPRAAAS